MSQETTLITGLKATDYGESYYQEHKDAGLDYLGHGFWQESYGLMVSEAALQKELFSRPKMFDAGCACGSILKGFKKTGIYSSVAGMDMSAHMVDLGRRHFGFAPSEIWSGSVESTGLDSGSITLIHCAQVLEHISDKNIDAVFREFYRILAPNGKTFFCLDAMRCGENKEMYMGDPTHVNIQPSLYWSRKLQDHGFTFDVEVYDRFVRSKRGPTEGDPRSFFEHYPYWSTWTMTKFA